MNNRVLDWTIKEKTGRTSRGSLLTTLWLGLALVVGLLAQTRQAEANSAPPAEYQRWRLPWEKDKPIAPPTEQQIAQALADCKKEAGGGDLLPFVTCVLKKLGRKTPANNCVLAWKTLYPDRIPEPCEMAKSASEEEQNDMCQECADQAALCCLLSKGPGAALDCENGIKRQADYLKCLSGTIKIR